MLKSIIAYVSEVMKVRTKKYVSPYDFKEYLRVEGVTYADVFPTARKE